MRRSHALTYVPLALLIPHGRLCSSVPKPHQNRERMSTTTPAPLSANTTETSANTEPTIVESIEEAAFIIEENPTMAVLIRSRQLPA